MKKKITEAHVTALLAERHKNDVFVSQCKTGQSLAADHFSILDAWCMKRSWSQQLMIGYEIKLSRSDFMQDQKFHKYLDYCNEFYFVTTSGTISKHEIPKEVGLIVLTKNANSLIKSKRAAYRQIDFPVDLIKYVLISRAEIQASSKIWSSAHSSNQKREFFEAWLQNKKIDQSFGRMLSKEIRTEVNKKILDVEYDNKRLQQQIEALEHIKKFLSDIGVENVEHFWDIRHKVRRMIYDTMPDDMILNRFLNTLQNVQRYAEDWQQTIKNIKDNIEEK